MIKKMLLIVKSLGPLKVNVVMDIAYMQKIYITNLSTHFQSLSKRVFDVINLYYVVFCDGWKNCVSICFHCFNTKEIYIVTHVLFFLFFCEKYSYPCLYIHRGRFFMKKNSPILETSFSELSISSWTFFFFFFFFGQGKKTHTHTSKFFTSFLRWSFSI